MCLHCRKKADEAYDRKKAAETDDTERWTMHRIIKQKDKPEVFVWNNNIEQALRLLHKQMGVSRSFKETRRPRKSKHLRQRRQDKRRRMYRDREYAVE